MRIRATIITASDTRSAGVAADLTTAALCEVFARADVTVVATRLVPDDADELAACMRRTCDDERVDLIVTTGGTGLGPRDVTPEATRAVIDREVPGIAEMLRAESATATRHAWLSRGIAGTRGTTLIVNLPGSPKGAVECLELVLPLVHHAVSVMGGAGHDHGGRVTT